MPLLLLAAIAAALLPAGTRLSVDPAASTIGFHVTHRLHRVDGSSSQVEGRAVVQEGGAVLAMVRVPVTSFGSGDANRDSHMVEVMEVNKYPFAVFKGVAPLGPGGQLPGGPLAMQGEIELHGVKRPVSVTLSVESQLGGALRVRGGFDVSLDAHGIERPSLLFVKIDDVCRIDLDLLLREERR